MRKNIKPIAFAVAIPLLLGGWALFRPELLFINTKVDEKAPTVAGQTSTILGKGSFVSYAHETKGTAEIHEVGGKRFLRLSGFSTSNGPDVRVYLVKGTDASNPGSDYVDLGSIKGNIGDQNYELPQDVNPEDFGSVAIWCKRFSVGFGGASLKDEESKPTSYRSSEEVSSWTLAAFQERIRVTSGNFRNGEGRASGFAELVEQSGKRTLQLKNVKANTTVRVYLVKAETIKSSDTVRKAEKLDLGLLKTANQSFPVPKDIDLWLYRSVSLWDTKKNVNAGDADLRSDQERPKTLA